jgi:hypothetical protein
MKMGPLHVNWTINYSTILLLYKHFQSAHLHNSIIPQLLLITSPSYIFHSHYRLSPLYFELKSYSSFFTLSSISFTLKSRHSRSNISSPLSLCNNLNRYQTLHIAPSLSNLTIKKSETHHMYSTATYDVWIGSAYD